MDLKLIALADLLLQRGLITLEERNLIKSGAIRDRGDEAIYLVINNEEKRRQEAAQEVPEGEGEATPGSPEHQTPASGTPGGNQEVPGPKEGTDSTPPKQLPSHQNGGNKVKGGVFGKGHK